MTRIATLLLLALALFCFPASAQRSAHTPPPGSAERAAVLDAVRQVAQKKLRQPVRFQVTHLKVQDGWAFLQGTPERANGKPVDYRGTLYQDAIDAGAFEETVTALVRKQPGGAWRVVEYDLGATDVVWEPWPRQYHAPRAIFPT
ncbi:MAG: hypothetical protein JO040_06000 [Gemmatimonadetes bacterium]|nr:hypothetical protein [Gemmatimonadota bacterium]